MNQIDPVNSQEGQLLVWFIIIGFIALIIIIFGVPYINVSRQPLIQEPTPISPPPDSSRKIGIDLLKIIKDPQIYQDLTVTTVGRITDWISPNSFRLSPIDNTSDYILAISSDSFPSPTQVGPQVLALGDTSLVEVTGSIEILDQNQVNQRLQGPTPETFQLQPTQPVLLINQTQKLQ